ncbi:7818_t:CDS:1, partial [Dentiscutata heterogama]
KKNLIDTLKIVNPQEHITTWAGRGSETKIDYIWVSQGWSRSIITSKAYEA